MSADSTEQGAPSFDGPGGYVTEVLYDKHATPTLAIVAIAVIIVAVVYLVWRAHHRAGGKTDRHVHFASSDGSLATDLHHAGWTLYTRPGCSWCEEQKRTITMPAPAVVDCGAGAHPMCAKISGFPHWHNEKTGAAVEGYQSTDKLERMV